MTACLTGVGRPEAIDDAALVTSELVANALEHAAVHPGASVSVTVRCAETKVHVEVHDDSDAPPYRPRHIDQFTERGRGLALVDAVATRWGYDHVTPGPGKRVWVELAYAA